MRHFFVFFSPMLLLGSVSADVEKVYDEPIHESGLAARLESMTTRRRLQGVPVSRGLEFAGWCLTDSGSDPNWTSSLGNVPTKEECWAKCDETSEAAACEWDGSNGHCTTFAARVGVAKGSSRGAWICYVKGDQIPFDEMTATQSSTRFGGVPSRPLTAEPSTTYRHRTCSHTDRENQPWWQVSLSRPYDITSVTITNRVGTNRAGADLAERLDGVSVIVDGVTCAENLHITATETIPCVATGVSEIRLQLPGREFLTVCGFSVTGTPSAVMACPPPASELAKITCPVLTALVANCDLRPDENGFVTKRQTFNAFIDTGISEMVATITTNANFDHLPEPKRINIFNMNTIKTAVGGNDPNGALEHFRSTGIRDGVIVRAALDTFLGEARGGNFTLEDTLRATSLFDIEAPHTNPPRHPVPSNDVNDDLRPSDPESGVPCAPDQSVQIAPGTPDLAAITVDPCFSALHGAIMFMHMEFGTPAGPDSVLSTEEMEGMWLHGTYPAGFAARRDARRAARRRTGHTSNHSSRPITIHTGDSIRALFASALPGPDADSSEDSNAGADADANDDADLPRRRPEEGRAQTSGGTEEGRAQTTGATIRALFASALMEIAKAMGMMHK